MSETNECMCQAQPDDPCYNDAAEGSALCAECEIDCVEDSQ